MIKDQSSKVTSTAIGTAVGFGCMVTGAHPFAAHESVLVWTVWYDNERCNIRSPRILEGSQLPAIREHLTSRWWLGFMGYDGHGPSHFRNLTGFVIVGESGMMLWHHSGDLQREVQMTPKLSDDLVDEIELGGDQLAALQRLRGSRSERRDAARTREEIFLGWSCESRRPVGFRVKKDERHLSERFLRGVVIPID